MKIVAHLFVMYFLPHCFYPLLGSHFLCVFTYVDRPTSLMKEERHIGGQIFIAGTLGDGVVVVGREERLMT